MSLPPCHPAPSRVNIWFVYKELKISIYTFHNETQSIAYTTQLKKQLQKKYSIARKAILILDLHISKMTVERISPAKFPEVIVCQESGWSLHIETDKPLKS